MIRLAVNIVAICISICCLLTFPVRSDWAAGPDMIYGRMDNTSVVWEGYLYTFGGVFDSATRVEKISVYGGPSWQECQEYEGLPIHPWRGSRLGNQYILFSNTTGPVHRKIFIYNFNANSWATKDLPESSPHVPDLWAPGVTTLDGYIWLLGGSLTGGSGDQMAVYRYDAADDVWVQKQSMHRVRDFFCVFTFDQKIWVAGGNGYDQSMNACEFYDPDTDIWTEDESLFSFLPVTVWGAGDAVFDNRLWVIGGVQNNQLSRNVWVYDPATNLWSAGLPLPFNRYRLDAASDGSAIYVAGGSVSSFTPSVTYQIYTISQNTQTPVPSFTPTPHPTSTPFFSPTPTRTQTRTPVITSTPTADYRTPSPSPTQNPDCDRMGVSLTMPADYYMPGMQFYLDAIICNTNVLLKKIPLFVILEVAGYFYFYPSWTEDVGFTRFDLNKGETFVPILPSFTWPDIDDSMTGLKFYGAITDASITEILGDYDVEVFGFGPPSQPTPTPPPPATASPTPTSPPGDPTHTPHLPSPTPAPSMRFIPGDDAGEIPGAGCDQSLVYCFELTAAGSASSQRAVATIENTGTDVLNVDLIPVSGDWNAFSLGTPSFSLDPGASREIWATFIPDAIRDFASELTISGSDGTGITLTLKGRSVPP